LGNSIKVLAGQPLFLFLSSVALLASRQVLYCGSLGVT